MERESSLLGDDIFGHPNTKILAGYKYLLSKGRARHSFQVPPHATGPKTRGGGVNSEIRDQIMKDTVCLKTIGASSKKQCMVSVVN